MSKIRRSNSHLQIAIPLQVAPNHQEEPTLAGTPFSFDAGFVIPGSYNMTYKLPNGDRLRLLARHDNHHSVQIILLTHDPEKIKALPGPRPASLVADTISSINRYLLLSDSYPLPKTSAQIEKYEFAQSCIKELTQLLQKERELSHDNWQAQEDLRIKVIQILNHYRNENIALANNVNVSEGKLDKIIYNSLLHARHYQFNRICPVSKKDQHEFSPLDNDSNNKPPFYIWDREIQDEELLKDSLRAIIRLYGLEESKSLTNVPANRFARFRKYLLRLLKDSKSWVDYQVMPEKPEHRQERKIKDGVYKYKIEPYYYLDGLEQAAYPSLAKLISAAGGNLSHIASLTNKESPLEYLEKNKDVSVVVLPDVGHLFIRKKNKISHLRYFKKNGHYYPLPSGEDLATLSQLTKRHLYFPERAKLAFIAFFSAIPPFFTRLYRSIRTFFYLLLDDFKRNLFENHTVNINREEKKEDYIKFLTRVLVENGLLKNDENLNDFLSNQIKNITMLSRVKSILSIPLPIQTLCIMLSKGRAIFLTFLSM